MEPHLSGKDKTMFYKYLDNATNYFEFGSGGSTYQASIRPNIQRIVTVESDQVWLDKLKKTIPESVQREKITFIHNEMDARPNDWGNPGPKATLQQKKAYSNHILSLPDFSRPNLSLVIPNLTLPKRSESWLVFIDGRFRVACCLKAHALENATIIFDDFLDRPQYHVVLNYFDVIESTTDNRMVVLKRKNVPVPPELITKYELIHG